jgi:hypothetical protein
MPDTTIKKVEADTSPEGEMGQRYLVAEMAFQCVYGWKNREAS